MPHTMKKIIFCAITMALLVLGACKQKEEPQSTPRIYMSYFTVNRFGSSGPADTLQVNTVDNTYVVDSISVGDTVHVDILLNAVSNLLTSFVVKMDTTQMKPTFSIYKQLDEALTADSEPEKGIFNFKVGYSGATIPMSYIARKSATVSVTMTVSSDSQYSPSSLSFKQPIR